MLDAITAVSGSGPAYLFHYLEAMIAAAEDRGFAPDMARRLAYATTRGAVELALQSPDPPSVLREQVTSKGGTTAAALAVLEARDVREAYIAAIRAADARAAELGDLLGRDA
jgi:pyrroline-5-carboxylate reductase